jgi:hypothetical protein
MGPGADDRGDEGAESAAFEPIAVATGRRSGILATVSIVGAIALVAVALNGRASQPSATSDSGVPRGAAAPGTEVAIPAPRADAAANRPVHDPARLVITLGGGAVSVSGTLDARAVRLVVAVEVGRAHRNADSTTLDFPDRQNVVRPEWSPAFETRLELPSDLPGGPVWLRVSAYDEWGVGVGTMRRLIILG